MTTPRNPQQNYENATLLDAVLLEISTALKAKLTWLNNSYTAAQKLAKKAENKNFFYPAVYTGQNEYLGLLPDGHLGNYSFFRLIDPENIKFYPRNVNIITTNFDLIFWFNLAKVYPTDKGRNIENVKQDILKAFRDMYLTRSSVQLTEVYKEAKNIYDDYTINEETESFMEHPYGALMFRGSITYKELC